MLFSCIPAFYNDGIKNLKIMAVKYKAVFFRKGFFESYKVKLLFLLHKRSYAINNIP
jgi:hypothetical protein